jgi:predicted nucleotidyltransferase component of viral defense system
VIAEGELRRLAREEEVDPVILNLDYALGWFLAGLYSAKAAHSRLRHKGGTCLAKAYFSDYRFSEDLDFTVTGPVQGDQALSEASRVARWSDRRGGPNFHAAPPRLEVSSDEYGAETFEVSVYFRGPLAWEGSPQAIRLHVTRDERLVLPAEERPLFHRYSDADQLGKVSLSCYPLLEMLAEKLRALCGQRRFAISRDLYDVHRLVASGTDLPILATVLKEKLAAKGMSLDVVAPKMILAREREFEMDWGRNLTHLLPKGQEVSFSDAWATTFSLLDSLCRVLA